MKKALKIARKGLGRSSPNPAVGSIITKNGQIVGRGFHPCTNTPHAEIYALNEANKLAKDATIYITLEPCNHYGHTSPCTWSILKTGIKRIVYGISDPNPKAQGGGNFLAIQGLNVLSGILRNKCYDEHRFFITYITKNRPYVILKTAATLDGKIATITGESKWITSKAARYEVHRWRNWCDAICVGIGTILTDNPQLTCRLPNGRDPLRIVIDSNLNLPVTAQVLNPKSNAPCLVVCGNEYSKHKRIALEQAGAEVIPIPKNQNRIDLKALLIELAHRKITSLFVEGGGNLVWSFLKNKLIDEIMYFLAPKLLGGTQAKSMIGGLGFSKITHATPLKLITIKRFGPDLLLNTQIKQNKI